MIKKDYITAILLGLAWTAVFFIFGVKTTTIEKIVSPITQFTQTFNPFRKMTKNISYQTFTYLPGWGANNLEHVHLDGVNIAAYYDIPVNADGSLIRDGAGYELFNSDLAKQIFTNAQEEGIKRVVSLSLTDRSYISALIYNPDAQQNLVNQAVQEVSNTGIDGINIDFDYQGTATEMDRQQFSEFVKTIVAGMHKQLPNSLVTVSIPTLAYNESIYDPHELAINSDKIFVEAYNFAVPEVTAAKVTAPIFGFVPSQYLNNIHTMLEAFVQQVPTNKLALEVAWYGNGNDYPLYNPNYPQSHKRDLNTLKTPLSQADINSLVAAVPAEAQPAARKNIPIIAKALEQEGILNSNVLAYALATIQHETAGTFEPIEEIKGRRSAKRLGYEGGGDFFGRGFIQLTHLRNYEKMGERIGMGDALARNPDLASSPEVAAKILAAFFNDNNVADLATQGDFVDARRPVNPDYMGSWIASLAYGYLNMLG